MHRRIEGTDGCMWLESELLSSTRLWRNDAQMNATSLALLLGLSAVMPSITRTRLSGIFHCVADIQLRKFQMQHSGYVVIETENAANSQGRINIRNKLYTFM